MFFLCPRPSPGVFLVCRVRHRAREVTDGRECVHETAVRVHDTSVGLLNTQTSVHNTHYPVPNGRDRGYAPIGTPLEDMLTPPYPNICVGVSYTPTEVYNTLIRCSILEEYDSSRRYWSRLHDF